MSDSFTSKLLMTSQFSSKSPKLTNLKIGHLMMNMKYQYYERNALIKASWAFIVYITNPIDLS